MPHDLAALRRSKGRAGNNRVPGPDLVGQRFGRYLVTEVDGGSSWRCLCDCGAVRKVRTWVLTSGGARSCGCLPRNDIEGRRFGHWEVLGRAGGRLWNVRCDCGTVATRVGSALRGGTSTHCGCLLGKNISEARRVHGESGSPTYRVWTAMIERCENPANKRFARYGGRGIAICARWRESFEAFLHDMGHVPAHGRTIDRIDNDGNYEPGNCRWATAEEQANNKSGTRRFLHEGRMLTMKEVCEETGISIHRMRRRIRSGMPIEDAVAMGNEHCRTSAPLPLSSPA